MDESKIEVSNDESEMDIARDDGNIAEETQTEVAGTRSDILEGAVIGNGEIKDVSDDSDSDDDGFKIVLGTNKQSNQVKRKSFARGENVYRRVDFNKSDQASSAQLDTEQYEEEEQEETRQTEIKTMRFSSKMTAYDIDFDTLDEHPWRQPGTDLTHFFNYGFNEATWLDYTEKQLKLRMKEGKGPRPLLQLK